MKGYEPEGSNPKGAGPRWGPFSADRAEGETEGSSPSLQLVADPQLKEDPVGSKSLPGFLLLETSIS